MKSLIKMTLVVLLLTNRTPLHGASAANTKTSATAPKKLISISEEDFSFILNNINLLTEKESRRLAQKAPSAIKNITAALTNTIDEEELTKDNTNILKGLFHLEQATDYLLPKDSIHRSFALPYSPHTTSLRTSNYSASTLHEFLEILKQRKVEAASPERTSATTTAHISPLSAGGIGTAAAPATPSTTSRSIYNPTTTPSGTTRSILDTTKK